MTKAKEGEFVPGYALHEFPFFIWYTYPQLLLKNAAPRPGSFFDRHGGSILGRRQQSPTKRIRTWSGRSSHSRCMVTISTIDASSTTTTAGPSKSRLSAFLKKRANVEDGKPVASVMRFAARPERAIW